MFEYLISEGSKVNFNIRSSPNSKGYRETHDDGDEHQNTYLYKLHCAN